MKQILLWTAAVILFVLCMTGVVFAAPGDKDALAIKDAQIKVLTAQAALSAIFQDPVIIKAQAAMQEAQAVLKAEIAKHPGCELQVDNAWKCTEAVKK